MGLLEIADALEKHPDARPSHKLLALQLRVQHDPALTDQYVADAVERFGKGDDETLAALAAFNTNGLLVQTAADTFVGRTITGTTNQITVTNPNGGSRNVIIAASGRVTVQ